MTAIDLLRRAYHYGPVLFGLGFLAPLIAQGLEAAGLQPPMGLTPTQFGLLAGLLLGTTAQLRGRRWV